MTRPANHKRQGGGRQRRVSVRAVRREQPDLRKLSRALIQLAIAQAAAEAAAQAERQSPAREPDPEDTAND